MQKYYAVYTLDILCKDWKLTSELRFLVNTMSAALPRGTSTKLLARLKTHSTVFFICDIQERFRDAIHRFPAVVTGAQRMTRAAAALSIPVVVTEQYPKGLGKTVAELDLTGASVVEKVQFTMCTPPVLQVLESKSATDVILCGLESHVCVQQTALDLIEQGYNVHLCVDAISSSCETGRVVGLHRSAGAGPLLTSTESVIFALIRSKEHEHFKAISSIVKETRPAEPLVGIM